MALAGRSTLYFDVRGGDKLLEANSKNPSVVDTGRRSSPGRLLGIDWGTKHVGLAVTDETGTSVRPLPHLERTSWKKTVKLLAEACEGYSVQGIVFGLPLQLDGSEGAAAQEARRVARNLALTLNLQVHLQDERLTTSEAEEFLRENGLAGARLREQVHSQAAAFILRDFLSVTDKQLTT